ncbi:acyltransferase family protein [Sphaerimonospora sp. CA-214678]|uniref:acyltransferase family protein n=1 Tax=Sphaerimonospora sp. CA-214678 TaxID=3240029 RepID=UPI003D8C06E5
MNLPVPLSDHHGVHEKSSRLGWLDGLRGVAAVAVAVHHATFVYTPHAREALLQWFNPGFWGVMVFFLISGYIIPASLERHGDVSRFWTSRIFRIYPLWTVGVAVLVVLAVTGISQLRGELHRFDPVTATLSHVTMMQDLLTVPNAINVLWTLSYEMAFYLLVAGLFTIRWHRRSVGTAASLITAGLLLSFLSPVTFFTGTIGAPAVVAVTTLIMAFAIGSAYFTGPKLRRTALLAGAVLALMLVTLNGRLSPWFGLSILAVMFTGTVLYRAEHGQVHWQTAALTAGSVLLIVVTQGWLHPDETEGGPISWTISMLSAAVAFGFGMVVLRRRTPKWLSLLGLTSFSVYLLHPLVLKVSDATVGRWREYDNPIPLIVFLLVLLPICWVTYRYVEKPMQQKGREITQRAASR